MLERRAPSRRNIFEIFGHNFTIEWRPADDLLRVTVDPAREEWTLLSDIPRREGVRVWGSEVPAHLALYLAPRPRQKNRVPGAAMELFGEPLRKAGWEVDGDLFAIHWRIEPTSIKQDAAEATQLILDARGILSFGAGAFRKRFLSVYDPNPPWGND